MSSKTASVSIALNVSVYDVEDRAEYRLCRGTSDHETVDTGNLYDFVSIGLRDATSVDDAHHFSLLRAEVSAHPTSYKVARFLNLVCTGYLFQF